ncbi:MAG TPA: metal-dependent hydrolase [Pyrinomonadaceae bacterium]|nr:metal-dependent hydrolase [Pyrinomonadaceae bacterium]
MPTIFSHAFFGIAIGSSFSPARSRIRFLILTALCTILPDFDVVGFAFGINYASVLGHRGITHSIAFAFLVGWLVAMVCFRHTEVPRWKLGLYFTAATLSHPFLDMFTNGGLGVALLAPFSNERFFSPWRPIQVSPIGAGFFSERGIGVALSELVWIWLPSIIVGAVVWLALRRCNQTVEVASLSGSSKEEL